MIDDYLASNTREEIFTQQVVPLELSLGNEETRNSKGVDV